MELEYIVSAIIRPRTREDIKQNVVRPNIEQIIGDDRDRIADIGKGVQFILVAMVNVMRHLQYGEPLHPSYIGLFDYIYQRRYVDELKFRVDIDNAGVLIENLLVREDLVTKEVLKMKQGREE